MLDQGIVAIYLVAILLLGLWSGRRIESMQQFAVAGRNFTSLAIFATLSASFIGGGFSIGNAEKVYLFGITNIAALWGFSLKEIMVGTFIAPRMGRFSDVISVGDIMKHDYGTAGKIITGIFSFLLCTGIVGAQVGGIGIVFHAFTGMPHTLGILIGCGIVIAYTSFGGMRAIVFTDIVQFLVLAVAMPVALWLGVRQAGGWAVVKAAVPLSHWQIPGDTMTTVAFLSLFATFLLGETLVPPYVQRLYIGRNASHTARGTLLSGIFSIPFFAVTGLIGMVALVLKPDLDANLALPFVIREVLPAGVRGFAIAGVISIVMSSADSFLNAASIALTHDIAKPLLGDRISRRQELVLAKLTTLAVGLLSVILAIRIRSVLDILIFAYNFWAPVILIPLTATLLGVRSNIWCFLASAVAGIAGTLAWNATLMQTTGIDGLIIGVFCNMCVFGLATTFLSRKPGTKGE